MGFHIGLSLALLLGMATACTSAKRAPAQVASSKPEAVVIPPVASPTKAGEHNFFLPRALHYIGKNRQIFLHVDWELIRNSQNYSLFDKYLVQKFSEEIESVENACGFSPLEVLSTVSIAWRESPDHKDFLFALTGDVTKNQLVACAKARGKTESASQLSTNFWPEPNMMLHKEDAQAPELEKEMEAGTLVDDPSFMAELRDFHDPRTAIWAIGTLSETLQKGISSSGMGLTSPSHFRMQVNLEDGVDAVFTMFFSKPSDATDMKDKLNSFLPMLNPMMGGSQYSKLFDYLSIDSQENTARLIFHVSQREAEDLLKLGEDDPCAGSADPLCGL